MVTGEDRSQESGVRSQEGGAAIGGAAGAGQVLTVAIAALQPAAPREDSPAGPDIPQTGTAAGKNVPPAAPPKPSDAAQTDGGAGKSAPTTSIPPPVPAQSPPAASAPPGAPPAAPAVPPSPPSAPADAPPAAGKTPGRIPAPSEVVTPNETPTPALGPRFTFGTYTASPNGDIAGEEGISVVYNGITLTADRFAGNLNREIVLSGHARIESPGATSYADAIHFFPVLRRYRLDNARSILTPDFLENRVYDNVYVTARDILGNRAGYTLGDNTTETTCIEPFHHYELRSRDAQLFPHKKLVLHQTSVIFFGAKLLTIPYIIIPLDRKPPRQARTDYFPEFGQNIDEGYYARFPYEFPEGQDAATYTQVSLTQKRGVRLRLEQEYLAGKQDNYYNTSGFGFGGGYSGGGSFGADAGGSYNSAFGYGNVGPRLPRLGVGLGPASGGLFTIQGYTNDGFNKNFNTSFRHQQGIGGNNRFGISEELQKQSFLLSTGQTTQNTRFDFAHDDNNHGVNALASLSLQTTDSANFATSQLTGSLRDAYTFAAKGSNRNALSFQFDLSRLLSTQKIAATTSAPASETTQRTARIDSQFQFQHTSREYQYSFNANKDTPFGPQSSNSSFGTLEKLPEFQFTADTINFKGGLLRQVPTTLQLDLGRYNEPTSKINTERLLAGFNVAQFSIMRGRTELVTGGGFEQRLYGDGAAQYITRNNTRLRQHLFGRSGIDLNYTYEQPEGGTPFAFDVFNRSHFLNLEGGYLDDRRFQATIRTGYDLSGRTFGKPWQTFAARLLWRPTPSARFDALGSYDPNTGKFFAITTQARWRGPKDFALDLVTRIDPQQPGIRRKFSQINTQLDIPFARGWRLAGLLRFNGNTGLFESRAVEALHEWDCMEASFSYSENPNGFRNDRQFYFAIRIKALPATRRFNRGPAGEALGVGVGDIY